MKKLLLILLCLPLLFGCSNQPSQKETNKQSIEEYFDENNKRVEVSELSKVTENNGIRHYKGKPFMGIAYTNYDNGNTKAEWNYEDGYKQGLNRVWHESGELKSKIMFKKDRKNGIFQLYFKNGQLELECNFKDDEYDGLMLSFLENGELYEYANFENGQEITKINYYNRGVDRMKKGKETNDRYYFREAIKDFEISIRLRKNHSEAYNNKGLAAVYLGSYAYAINDFTQAIIINPSFGMAYNNRGVAKNLLNSSENPVYIEYEGVTYTGACEDINKAIELGYPVNESAKREICK